MKSNTVSSLARSEDAVLRAAGIERLLHGHPIDEGARISLREAIPRLTFEQLLELLSRHGDLASPGAIVERLVALFPTDETGQLFYFFLRQGFTSTLAGALDEDAYADVVEKVLPRIITPRFKRELAQRLRGCPRFNDIVKGDADRDDSSIQLAPESLAVLLIDVRRDERACRARLEELITSGNRGELLRLESVLVRTRLDDLTRRAQQCLLVSFEFRKELGDENKEWLVDNEHLSFVVRWAMTGGTERPVRLAWFADQVAKLEESGAWFDVRGYRESLPADLVHEITLLLINRGEPPRWAGKILIERLASRDAAAWDDLFGWWKRFGYHDLSWNHAERKAIVTTVPLPLSPPADFDDNLLACARDLIASESERIGLWKQSYAAAGGKDCTEDLPLWWHGEAPLPQAVEYQIKHLRPLATIETAVERLLQMELTPARAHEIARLRSRSDTLLRHPRCQEIAALVSPLDEAMLPPFKRVNLESAEQVTLYRKLGGKAADANLRNHVRQAIVGDDSTPSVYPPFPDPSAWCAWPWLQDFLDDGDRSAMRARLATATLHEVLMWRRLMPAIVDDELIEGAAQRDLDADRRWVYFDLLPSLRPFVEQRLLRAADDDELFSLLDWLEARGLPRAAQIDAVIAHIERRPPTRLLERIPALLPTRSAWEQHGPRLLRALLRWNDSAMIHRLWFALHQSVRRAPPTAAGATGRSEEQIDALLDATHLAFATVLLELASLAAEAHDEARLLALLSAVLKLDPPPAIVPMLRRLTRWPDLSIRAQEWITQGTMLFKSKAGRTASFDALLEATNLMPVASRAPLPAPDA